MKWTLLIDFALICCVVADGAWKVNYEYKYRFTSKSLTGVPKLSNPWTNADFNAFLTINPQSDNLLIGQLSGAEYAERELSNKWDPNIVELPYKQLPSTEPFEIHLKNGTIHALSVDGETSNDQINRLKVIVSLLQVDATSGKNGIDVDGDYDLYKTTEETIFGNCETIYDVTPLPDNSIQSDPELIPMAKFKDNGKFVNIVKSRNYNNCTEIIELMYERGSSPILDSVINSEANRIVLIGSKKSYSILSSSTTNRVVSFDGQFSTTIFHVRLALASMEKSSKHLAIGGESMLTIGSLIYNKNLQSNVLNTTAGALQGKDIRWSNCYTTFVAGSTMCKHSYSAEWESVGVKSGCGYIGFGQRAACKHSFPGCSVTACWSLFITGLCDKEFGSRLPINNGGFEDCSPGFWRARCCPN